MLRSSLAFAVTLALFGCGGDVSPLEPEGGLEAFAEALAAANADEVYGRLSTDTQALCVNALQTLRETDEAIGQLQPSDQADAREATGVAILETVETPEQLFATLINTGAIPSLNENASYRVGMEAAELVPVAPDAVLIVSKAEQEFEMRLSNDGEWRVREPMYSLLESATAHIAENAEAVDNAVRLFGLGMEVDDELRRLGLLAETNAE